MLWNITVMIDENKTKNSECSLLTQLKTSWNIWYSHIGMSKNLELSDCGQIIMHSKVF